MLNMENWKNEKLRQCVEINVETLNSNTNLDYQFKYIDISSVSKGKIDVPTDPISYGSSPSRARRIFQKGDILFGTVRPYLQSHAYVNFDVKDMIASTGFAVLRAKNNVISKYLYHYIFSDEIQKQIDSLLVGSNYPAINSTDVGNLLINLPPLPEQKKIAEILSTWDEAIELKKQQLKEYENYFNQCLNKMFETRDMKQGLVLGSLIVEENKTKNQSSSRGFSGAYPFFTNSTEEVAKKTDYFDFDGKYIIANTGGRAYFDYFEGKFGAMSDCYVFTSKEINVKYLYYWLKRQEKYIDFVGFVGSGLNHLDKKWFKKLPVPVPARSRQEKIVEALDSINFAREKINKQIDLLMLQKQGLMQRLLTGKVRVKLD